MSKRSIDAEKLIADYGVAYKAFNGKDPPRITYENGWFVFRPDGPSYGTNMYRRRNLEEMMARLIEQEAHKKAVAS